LAAIFRHITIYTFFSLLALWAWSKTPPEAPKGNQRFVNDYGEVLSPDQEIFLTKKLLDYFDSTSTEIVIVTERSLEGHELFDYCQRLAEAWGIGQADKDNGILIYLAVDDRKVRIHTGYGTEGAITDALSKRIIEKNFKPQFRQEKYALGLHEGTDIIIKALAGEYTYDLERKGGQGFPLWVVILIIVIVIIFLSGRGGNDGRTYSGRSYHPPVYWGGWGSGRSSGGFGGGGWGGGGFGGGFGGGSFGGGGASGSW
jgi:uncharacterized protein